MADRPDEREAGQAEEAAPDGAPVEDRKEAGSTAYPVGYGSAPTYVRASHRVGRNEPCPCGSGKKYKKCCGRP